MDHDSPRDAKKVVILAEDWKAARDYMRASIDQSSLDAEQLDRIEERLASFHAAHGEDEFQLIHRGRQPRCEYERILKDFFSDKITNDEAMERYAAADNQPIDATVIRVYYEELECSLDHLRQFLTWVWERQPSNSHRPRTARRPEYSLREMMRCGCLSRKKVQQLWQFVRDARVAKSLGRARHGATVAATAVDLARLIFDNTNALWASCVKIAGSSQTDPRYLYATTAEELAHDSVKDYHLGEVDSLLAEEEAVCRWFLAQQGQSQSAAAIQNNTFHIQGTGHTIAPQVSASAAASDAQPSDSHVGSPPAVRQDSQSEKAVRHEASPKLRNWAIGLDDSHRWWLFHKRMGRWEQSTELNVPKGNPDSILRLLAERGGALDRAEVHAHLKGTYSGKRPAELTRICTDALQKAKAAIRQAIAECGPFEFTNVPNPIPWDDPTWRADIGIGYVVQDEDGRPDFKTHDGLTGDDRLDRS